MSDPVIPGSMGGVIRDINRRLATLEGRRSPALAQTIIDLSTVTGDLAALTGVVDGKVAKSGDTMTGALNISTATLNMGSVIGDRINVYGTDYKLGIEGGTLYYASNDVHKFYRSGTERFRVDNFGAYASPTNGGFCRIGTIGGGTWTGVDSSGGYLLLTNAGASNNVYLRSRTTAPVYIGAQESNTVAVYNGYAHVQGMRLGAWSSDANWTAAASGPSGYMLLGGNYGGSAGSYLRATGPLYFAAASNYVRFENWIKLDSMNGGANYLAVDANGYMYTAASRRELKEDIAPLPLDTGEIIDALEPVQFIFKNLHPEFGELSPEADEWRKNDIKYGFIVEDVAAVNEKLAIYDLPKRDVLDEDGAPVIDPEDPAKERILQEPTGELRPSDWDHKPFIAILVKEVQELRKRVAALEARPAPPATPPPPSV